MEFWLTLQQRPVQTLNEQICTFSTFHHKILTMINFLEPNHLPSSLYIMSLCVRVYWLLLLEQNKCYMYLFNFRSHNIVEGMIFIWCTFERSSWLHCVYNLTIDIVLISNRSERENKDTIPNQECNSSGSSAKQSWSSNCHSGWCANGKFFVWKCLFWLGAITPSVIHPRHFSVILKP